MEEKTKKVEDMLEEGLTPSEVLKSIADEEKLETKVTVATRRLATKDLAFQEAAIQLKMKPAIK